MPPRLPSPPRHMGQAYQASRLRIPAARWRVRGVERALPEGMQSRQIGLQRRRRRYRGSMPLPPNAFEWTMGALPLPLQLRWRPVATCCAPPGRRFRPEVLLPSPPTSSLAPTARAWTRPLPRGWDQGSSDPVAQAQAQPAGSGATALLPMRLLPTPSRGFATSAWTRPSSWGLRRRRGGQASVVVLEGEALPELVTHQARWRLLRARW